MPGIAIITTQAFSLWNFRGPLIRALTERGVCVYALAPDFDDGLRARVVELGARPMDYPLSRTGINLLQDAVGIFKLSQLIKRLAPDITFTYFIKPVIYGSIAAWLARVPKRFAIIEGLGYVFLDNPGLSWRRLLLRKTVSLLYNFALRLNQKVFFLNQDDIDQFVKEGIVDERMVVRLDGIGIDINHYTPAPSVVETVTFILIARMLREKGVYDFIDAARQVRKRYPQVKFLLVGGVDQNPGSVKESELRAWVEEGIVEWPGHVDDVRPWFAKSSVFVLPSYYREGLPRGNQEAMAMGRPVITTDWVGCRETVKNGISGFLVPICNPEALAYAMIRFVEAPELIAKMGQEGRRIAEERFDVHAINRQILEILGL